MSVTLDDFDRRILQALQENARLSNVALAERVLLSPSQCSRRLQALEAAGLIGGYHARLDREAVGLGVLAYVTVTLGAHGEDRARAFHDAVVAMPAVLECQLITGDGDYLLKVVAADLNAFSRILTDELMRLPGVSNLRSNIALTAIKDSAVLPIGAPSGR